MKLFFRALTVIAFPFIISCSDQQTTTEASEETAWTNLTEGKNINDLWRSTAKSQTGEYLQIGARWELKEGVISLDRARKGTGGHIETKTNYHNFELKFDFRIEEGCNSGIKYRCKNALGIEYQLLDDDNHKDNKKPSHRTAGLYEIVAVPADRKLNPAGEWNTGKIVANNNTLEHWLNGVKVISIEFGSDEWKARFEKSKYHKNGITDFATHTGPIHFQDHSDTDISFKNVYIRELK